VLLGLLIAIDAVSAFVYQPFTMIVVRTLHGMAGGMLVGFAFSVIARTQRPERTFGMLLVVQDGLGGLGVMFLPQLVPTHGTKVLFLALIAFSIVTLVMLCFLDDYPRAETTTHQHRSSARLLPLICALLAVFLFQFSNMLLFTYIIGLAEHFTINGVRAGAIVGVSTWIGIIGSILVIVVTTRFGRSVVLSIALMFTAWGMWILHNSANINMYALSNCGTAITWSFTIPYLLGMCSKFDTTGRAAAFAGFASKMGLATGPLVGALLLNGVRYDLLINVAIVGIAACLAISLFPARLLDRIDRDTART
jgi:MFS family permease